MISDPPSPPGVPPSKQPNATIPSGERRVPATRLEVTVVKEGGEKASRVVMLDGERFQIGSHPKNHLVLDDSAVSRFHCVIERGELSWRVTDAGSLNGTRLGGICVRDADLPPQTNLDIGNSTIQIREVPATTHVAVLDQASFGELFGNSIAMQRLFAILEKVSASDANVLIEGESGTGKEIVATEIVRRGARAKKPFIIVDCSAIAPSLIESELFGHARGAFTNADRERAGAFEAAHGGTVFLDEIGELPPEMQPKLLRAIEAREIRRVGENTPRKVDVRVVAATNRRLDREVNHGRFREDLYYRLSVVTVRVPPLRERLDDIGILVRTFLRSLNASQNEVDLFGPDVIERLMRHDWPGNVRELRNYVERCVVMQSSSLPTSRERTLDNDKVDGGDTVPTPASAEAKTKSSDQVDLDVPFRVAKEQAIMSFERHYVEALIQWAGGNVSKAARRANMDRMNLYRILQRSGLRSIDE